MNLGKLDAPKTLDLNEFVQLGYLQEVNRCFFHPLGLALSVQRDKETGDIVSLGPIWDVRHDSEDMVFDQVDQEKYRYIEVQWHRRDLDRTLRLGFMIQPVGEQD